MFDFDRRVDRTGMATVKQAYTPKEIAGSGVMSLWGAEFEFPTAPFVVDAVVEWAKKGLYAYTVADDAFYSLVQRWMKMHRRWQIEKEWIVPAYGITMSVAQAARACLEPGEGIIGFTPGYHMYWEAVEWSDRVKVPCPLIYDGERYTIDWQDFEQKMADPANKMLLLTNPHNPLGRVWDREELRRIGELAKAHGIIVFSDEIFAECVYDGVEMLTFDQVMPDPPKTMVATSLGKWLSFTGTTQANIIIRDEGLRRAFTAQRDREFYGSMNPIMRPAYFAAYTPKGEEWLKEMMAYLWQNYQLTDRFFQERIPQFKAIRPDGATILWVDATAMGMEDEAFQRFMNERAHFHVDHATRYSGEPGFFRMTLSVPRAELLRALEALESAVKAL